MSRSIAVICSRLSHAMFTIAGIITLATLAMLTIGASAQFTGPVVFTAPLGAGCVPDPLGRTADLGGFYSGSGFLQPYSWSGLVATQMFINRRNALCGAGGLGIPMRFTGCDMQSNVSMIQACAKALLAANVTTILLPEGATAVPAAAALTALNVTMPLIAGMSGFTSLFVNAAGKRVFPNVFGVLTPASLYFDPFVVMMRGQRYSTAAIVTRTQNPLTADHDATMGSIQSFEDNKITVLIVIQVDIETTDTSVQIYTKIYNALAQAKALNPDILVTGFGLQCDSLYAAVGTLNFNPQAHGTFECANAFASFPSSKTLAQWSFSPVQWDSSLSGPKFSDLDCATQPFACLFTPTNYSTSAQLYNNAYIDTNAAMTSTVIPTTSLTIGQVGALNLADYAIWFSGGIFDPDTLRRSMQSANFGSMFGQISASTTGQNSLRSIPLKQVVDTNGNYLIVSPGINLPVLPMPAINQRNFIPKQLSTPTEKAFLAIASSSACICLTVAFIVIYYRNAPSVKAQSVPFCIVLLCGCIILAWATFTKSVMADDAQCKGMAVVWYSAAITVLGPIAIRSWRIHTIVNSKSLVVKSIGDGKLFGIMLLLMSGLIVAIIATLAANDMVVQTIVYDPYRLVYNYNVCVSDNGTSSKIAYFAMAWTLAVLGFTWYVAFRIRNLNGSLLRYNNSAKLSILAMVNGIVMVLGGAVTFGIPDAESNHEMKFGFLAGLTNFMAIFTSIVCFIDPFMSISSTGGNENATQLNVSVEKPGSGQKSNISPNRNPRAVHPIIVPSRQQIYKSSLLNKVSLSTPVTPMGKNTYAIDATPEVSPNDSP